MGNTAAAVGAGHLPAVAADIPAGRAGLAGSPAGIAGLAGSPAGLAGLAGSPAVKSAAGDGQRENRKVLSLQLEW